MTTSHKKLLPPLDDRGPLRILFLLTSMPVGGAETLLVNLVRRMDRSRFLPEICCLKELGPLGEEMARETPVHSRLLAGKYDVRVLPRLVRLMRRRRIDAAITVGAGDKMFWGRLAAWRAGVPVVLSALHSTGWPDGVGRLNRWLTPLTDSFIAVAAAHGRHLVERERFPADKVRVIPNGVDAERFRPDPAARRAIRGEIAIADDAPVFSIVAALRPEKNHRLFVEAAALVRKECAAARFLVVGDGPERNSIEKAARDAGLGDSLLLLGTRGDVPQVLAASDGFVLTSHNEANPVSILEAMSTGLPVVATRVGSVAESVEDEITGFLVQPGDAQAIARHCVALACDVALRREMGGTARERVMRYWSLDAMVEGYQKLIADVYQSKSDRSRLLATAHRYADEVTAAR